ncbi:MAG: hypothetical protein ABIT37_22950 [Luteolibacter sp.]
MNLHLPTALAFSALLAPMALAAPPAALYVSPSGDDKNPGTLEQPFKSITRARDAVRKGGYHKAKSSNLWEEFINVPQSYRYLRVITTDPKAVLSMDEFFAYGYRENLVR